jgi:hypothetical protein
MAQAVSRRRLTAEARVRAMVSLFSRSSVFPCQYRSTVALHAHISHAG